MRDFAPFGGASLPPGLGNDLGAVIRIVYPAADDSHSWLAAGLGLPAVLLTGAANGLSAPISDVTDAWAAREELRGMLPGGYPQVAVRVGYAPFGEPPWTPRRLPSEVITELQR